ncbi:hypothetical protein [Lentzea sp. NPDC055074]
MSTATTTVNGVTTDFTPCTRPGYMDTPVLATVVVSVPMDYDDLVAALFEWGSLDDSCIALADDDQARSLVVEAVVNVGLTRVEAVRDEIEEMGAGDGRRAWLMLCRNRVTQLFPATTPRPRRRQCAAPRELVTA